MSPDRKRPPRPATSAEGRPLRRRAHAMVEDLLTSAMSHEEQVRLARVVLRSGSREAINRLFEYFQRCQAETRWGRDNPLHEIAGAMRVQAIRALRGPPGQHSRNHRSALLVLWVAGRPGDVPLLVSLLAAQDPDGLDRDILPVLQHVISGYEPSDPDLIAPIERFIERTASLQDIHAASLVLREYRVSEAESALQRALASPDPWRRAPVMAALIVRNPGQHWHAGEALLAALKLEARTAEAWDKDSVQRALAEALDGAKEGFESREEVGLPPVPEAWIEELDHVADEDCAAFLDRLGREFTLDQALLLPRLQTASLAQKKALLRALGAVATGGTPFFHAVWPFTSDPDEEIAALAIAACGTTRSDQARMRLTARLRGAIARDDAAAARPLLTGLRGCLHDGAVWSAALSLRCEIARRLAIEGLEHGAVLRGPAIELLNEAARRESNQGLRRRMDRLLRER
ncbi:hypothetical protein [Sorangium atrum]|uniref:HEAT repeat domain-containing protein n=1 Tax=Sorangium atrum TaxID=2995308 RepID=A0ABT5BSB2_9BACT|nr:hypothetical protein [Sorangium aterium]MDC0677056.1 hypothetical protein [Sorangium aterium]